MHGTKTILLIEDDDIDVMTVKRVFKEINIPNKLVHKADGEEALEYLRDENNEEPCVILLDLNMPRMDGFEFLETIKGDNNLKKIPIIILTTSGISQSVTESFKLGAAGYMVKPVDYKQFVNIIKTVEVYWTLSKIPPDESSKDATE